MPRSPWPLPFAAAALLLGNGACWLVASLGEFPPQQTTAGEAGAAPEGGKSDDARPAADAGERLDASGDEASAPPNLLVDPGFELPGNCVQWEPINAVVRATPLARSGISACEVCFASPSVYGIRQQVTLAIRPDAGQLYAGSVWLHAPEDDAGPPGGSFTLTIDGTVGNGPGVLAPGWTHLPGSTITKGAETSLSFDVFATGYGCFVVDDAELHREP